MRASDTSFSTILRVVIVAATVFVTSCGGGDGAGGDAGGNAAPVTPAIAPCGGAGQTSCPLLHLGPNSRYAFGVVNVEVRSSLAVRVDLLVDGTTVASSANYTTFQFERRFTLPWDTAAASEGVHAVVARAFDSQGLSADTAIAPVIVKNEVAIPLELSKEGIAPRPALDPTGTGELRVNLASGVISGGFSVVGVTTIDSAHLHRGYAGDAGMPDGDILLSLVRNVNDPGRWDLPAGSMLSPQTVQALMQGIIYIDAHSSTVAFPEGTLRGQLQPHGVKVWYADVTGAQVVPPVNTQLEGVAALTLAGKELTLYVTAFDSGGLVSGTGGRVYEGPIGANGTGRVPLILDGSSWYTAHMPVSTTMDALRTSAMYVLLETAAFPAGEIRGQLNAFVGVKLSGLQTSIFTPRCSGCHNGVGSQLPGSLDLRDGRSYASLVGVASLQQGSVKRVEVHSEQHSYLIHKVEGLSTITGDRMPQSAPMLTREEIDAIRTWIDLGARND